MSLMKMMKQDLAFMIYQLNGMATLKEVGCRQQEKIK